MVVAAPIRPPSQTDPILHTPTALAQVRSRPHSSADAKVHRSTLVFFSLRPAAVQIGLASRIPPMTMCIIPCRAQRPFGGHAVMGLHYHTVVRFFVFWLF